ncbi:MAG: hypothetical protein AB7T06_34060 [Kofleriaceae bacterium]
MHRAALVILIALVPSIAAAQAPPSKTLERAIKLYDKQDFFSTSVELKKVLDAETGDSAENIERARFFMAKTFYQLRFHVPSYVMFQQIIQGNGMYRTPSFKWIAALGKVLPYAYLAPALDTLTEDDLADPTLASSREELVWIRNAKIPVRHDLHLIARNALGCTHPDPRRMSELVQKLRDYDDNVELVAATRTTLRTDDVFAQTIDLAMAKAPLVRDARRWVAELREELELLSRSDRAWLTTVIAAELLQEVTVQQSVGEADLGARLRDLLDAMQGEIAGSASYSTSPEQCTREGGPIIAEPLRRGTGPFAARGCCSTGDGSPAGGGLLVALVAVALRRKSRAASGTRSPRA